VWFSPICGGLIRIFFRFSTLCFIVAKSTSLTHQPQAEPGSRKLPANASQHRNGLATTRQETGRRRKSRTELRGTGSGYMVGGGVGSLLHSLLAGNARQWYHNHHDGSGQSSWRLHDFARQEEAISTEKRDKRITGLKKRDQGR
jgi:hypothetical protein